MSTESMPSIEQEGHWLVGLPHEKKLLFLSALAHELTIVGRHSYRPQTEALEKPGQLRSVNEVQHRVLACLVQLQLGVEFQEVAHGRDAAHGRLAVECGVWPMPVVAMQEGLQGRLALR